MTGVRSTQKQIALQMLDAKMTMTVSHYLDEQCETIVRDIENQVVKELSNRRKICDEMKAESIRKTDELIQKLEEMIAAEEA